MKKNTALFFLILIAYSCSNDVNEKKESLVDSKEGYVITLTDEQKKSIGIEHVNMSKKTIKNILEVNGILDVPPNSLLSVSAPMGGFVKMPEVLQGMRVKKGQLLARLEHQDYIQLQQDYLEEKIQLELITLDYEREKALNKDNVSALRNLQEITTRYKSSLNKVNALESRLSLIGINASDLKEGGINKEVKILSPIDGYVIRVNVNAGKYVLPENVLFEIVDIRHLHAEITIYEKDLPFIKQGQKISFIPMNDLKERNATVYLTGYSVSQDRTISIHAHIDNPDPALMPGMFIKAKIEIDSKETFAVPSEAIIRFADSEYIFVLKSKLKYEMIPIKSGASNEGYSEIIITDNNKIENPIIVSKGAFQLLSLLKNTEEE